MRSTLLRTLFGALLAAGIVAAQATADSLAGGGHGNGLPPPTPVGPKASLSPFVTSLRTPADDSVAPDVAAPSVVLADLDSGQLLLSKNVNQSRPIASVTKIMTALLVLGRTSPADVVRVSARAAAPEGTSGLSELGLEPGERISVGELTWALLLESANDAAQALAETVAGTTERFVALMNATARRLGMTHTRFRSPSGLDDRGRSSAADLVTLTRAAFAESSRFSHIVGTRFHLVPSPEGRARHIQNRNVLLWLYRGATGVKTGYTSDAGYCIVATASRGGRRLIAVVLGDRTEPFSDAAALLDYGFAAFSTERVVESGESLGAVQVVGGSVEAQTASALTALVPASSGATLRRVIDVDPAAAYPPAMGERIGALKVWIPGHLLGSVPVVVSGVPAPPPLEDEAWWIRAAGVVTGSVCSALHAMFG